MGYYHYHFNGLNVRSELKLLEVAELDNRKLGSFEKVITFRYGKVPERLHNPLYDNSLVSVEGDCVLVNIEHIARYLVNGDTEVIIESQPGANEDNVRIFLLSVVLSVLLHKRDFLNIHAATIKVGDAAVLIAGRSGAGKSTLSLGMFRKGYEIINDDISSIFFTTDGTPMVHPGYHHIKLMAKSLEMYNYDLASFKKLRSKIEKYTFPFTRTVNAPVPLKAIFLLKESSELEIQSESVIGLAKFHAIKNNTYRYKLVEKLDKAKNHFMLSSLLSNKLQVINIHRSFEVTPADFADYMEEQLQSV